MKSFFFQIDCPAAFQTVHELECDDFSDLLYEVYSEVLRKGLRPGTRFRLIRVHGPVIRSWTDLTLTDRGVQVDLA